MHTQCDITVPTVDALLIYEVFYVICTLSATQPFPRWMRYLFARYSTLYAHSVRHNRSHGGCATYLRGILRYMHTQCDTTVPTVDALLICEVFYVICTLSATQPFPRWMRYLFARYSTLYAHSVRHNRSHGGCATYLRSSLQDDSRRYRPD